MRRFGECCGQHIVWVDFPAGRHTRAGAGLSSTSGRASEFRAWAGVLVGAASVFGIAYLYRGCIGYGIEAFVWVFPAVLIAAGAGAAFETSGERFKSAVFSGAVVAVLAVLVIGGLVWAQDCTGE